MKNSAPKTNIPPYVAYYGMVRDPFTQEIEDDLFYAEPSRKQRLGTMLHLTQFGNELMLVTGPKGSGKTTLLQQFNASAPKTWKLARIEAQGGLDERKLLQHLYRQMGMKFEGATHNELLKQMIIHLELLQKKGIYSVMLINNAEKLPSTALFKVLEISSLKSTVNKPLLRVILFGGESLTNKLDDPLLKKFSNLPKRTMNLEPFDEEQTVHYVMHRLSAAHFSSNDLFPTSVLQKIFRDSYGWPERINELASNILLDSLPANIRGSLDNTNTKSFKLSRTLGLFFIVSIVAAFFVIQKSNDDWANQLKARVIAFTNSISPQPAPAPKTVIAKNPVPIQNKSLSLVEQLKMRESASQSAATKKKPTEIKVAEPKIIPTTKQKPDVIKKPVDAVITSTEPTFDLSSIPRKEAWILNQNPRHYTLQIIGVQRLKTIGEFIKAHKLYNNIAFYRGVRRDKPWYGIIYGVYPNKQAASSAIKELPEKIQQQQPWIRSLNSIRGEIYKTRPK